MRPFTHDLLNMLAGGLIVCAIWILPERIERFTAPAQTLDSPYLSAPGNRTRCESGAWIAMQADSGRNPWLVRCTEKKP